MLTLEGLELELRNLLELKLAEELRDLEIAEPKS